jgi:hypothetical protein
MTMKIGDRVRDIGTQFVGTLIQFDPPTGLAARVLIQADDTGSSDRKVGDPPPDKMWQKVDQVELVDLAGESVKGKSAGTVNTAGRRVDAAGNIVDTQMGGEFDAQGNRIKNGTKSAAKSA